MPAFHCRPVWGITTPPNESGDRVSLGALATAFLLPPVNLVLMGVAGWAVSPRYPRAGHIVRNAALLALLLLALPVTARLLLDSLETGLKLTSPANSPPGAIVILSANSSRNRAGADAIPPVDIGDLTLARLRTGAALQRRTGLPVLVTGGVLAPGEPPIAVLMAGSLRDDFAIQARWIEADSADTWENARRSAALLRADGIGSVYLVTHPWHMRRALLAFAHFGIAATAAPTGLDRWPTGRFDEFVPDARAWTISYYAIHEWLGLAVYALRAHEN